MGDIYNTYQVIRSQRMVHFFGHRVYGPSQSSQKVVEFPYTFLYPIIRRQFPSIVVR